jgi:small subunit ribosomal protein S4e
MTRNHLKRINMPNTWPVKRKKDEWVAKPRPGSHKLKQGLSLQTALVDLLGLAKNSREAKIVLGNNDVLVDGKRRRDPRYLIGITDVLSIPSIKKHWRMTFSSKGKLEFFEIKEEESKFKAIKITKKIASGKDKFELHTIDGRTILSDAKNITVGDGIKIELPSQKMSSLIKLEKGTTVFLIGGKHVGNQGVVKNLDGKDIVIGSGKNMFKTVKKFALPTGTDKDILGMTNGTSNA